MLLPTTYCPSIRLLICHSGTGRLFSSSISLENPMILPPLAAAAMLTVPETVATAPWTEAASPSPSTTSATPTSTRFLI